MLNDIQIATLVERLKADLEYHQNVRDQLAGDMSDLDVAYDAETDTAHSFHAGRVEAMGNVLDILLGKEVELYSETIAEEAPEPQDDEELLERVYGVPRPHPCVNGHFDCATTEGGSCANELYAALLAKKQS